MTDKVDGTKLMSVIERVERLKEEQKAITEDIKEVFAEAKGNGLEPKYIKYVIGLRAQEPEKRKEDDDMKSIYRAAGGVD